MLSDCRTLNIQKFQFLSPKFKMTRDPLSHTLKVFDARTIYAGGFIGGGDWHLFVGRERGQCKTPRETIDVAFRTTRWFVRKDDAWRLLHHHGSVEDPKMLADYQRLIFSERK